MNVAATQFLDQGREAVEALARKAEITDADVATLRREIFADGAVGRAEADALFDLERSNAVKSAGWTPFFIEAITDHVVWQVRPTGVISAAQGEWLIEQADRARTLNAFACLVNTLAEAHRVPLWFVAAVRARAARGWPGTEIAIAAACEEMAMAA